MWNLRDRKSVKFTHCVLTKLILSLNYNPLLSKLDTLHKLKRGTLFLTFVTCFDDIFFYFTQCENYWNLLSHFFWQKICESNVFTKDVISRKKKSVRGNFFFFHTVLLLLYFCSKSCKKESFCSQSIEIVLFVLLSSPFPVIARLYVSVNVSWVNIRKKS